MSNTNDFTHSQIGDKLWAIGFGWVTVSRNSLENPEVEVTTADRVRLFCSKIQPKEKQTLFFGEPLIVAPSAPPPAKKPRPHIPPGALLTVWDDGESRHLVRRFAGWSERDRVLCYWDGDNKGGSIAWGHWEYAPETQRIATLEKAAAEVLELLEEGNKSRVIPIGIMIEKLRIILGHPVQGNKNE